LPRPPAPQLLLFPVQQHANVYKYAEISAEPQQQNSKIELNQLLLLLLLLPYRRCRKMSGNSKVAYGMERQQ
jgi:hypothetical protein